jgi:hypothetical protein
MSLHTNRDAESRVIDGMQFLCDEWASHGVPSTLHPDMRVVWTTDRRRYCSSIPRLVERARIRGRWNNDYQVAEMANAGCAIRIVISSRSMRNGIVLVLRSGPSTNFTRRGFPDRLASVIVERIDRSRRSRFNQVASARSPSRSSACPTRTKSPSNCSLHCSVPHFSTSPCDDVETWRELDEPMEERDSVHQRHDQR